MIKGFMTMIGLFAWFSTKRMAYSIAVRLSLKSNAMYATVRPLLKKDLHS